MLTSPRFYAPWCGHCQNLKPAYESAAKGLKGLAQVVAVNCDDESSKDFCGSLGVKGFPTLKIIKPSKKPGKPSVEDYQGPRTASGIVDAVKSAIPNSVKRITDKGLDGWFKSDNETAKAVLFSEKGTTSALIKVLASEYLNSMQFAQIRNKEAAAVEMFGVEEYPTLFVLPGGSKDAVKFDGKFTKEAIMEFLSQFATPSAAPSGKKSKSSSKKSTATTENKAKSSSDSSTVSEAPSPDASSKASAKTVSEATEGLSITVEPLSEPTESPEPMTFPDAPKPAKMPDIPEPIPAFIEEKYLEEKCLGLKTSTCILALLPQPADEEGALPANAIAALSSLSEVADKHAQRGGKLGIYSVPARNAGQARIRDALKLKDDKSVELVAINSRRGWWRHYEAEEFSMLPVEAWIDNIRLGEGQKSKLPEALTPAEEEPAPEHGEL